MEVLHDLQNIEFFSLQDLGMENDAEETGTTYEENSLIKARHFFEKTGMITIGEDSGIEVEALKNELGVRTRRWGAGEEASDEEWLEYFLRRIEQEQNKRAKFVCVPTIVWSRELGADSRKRAARSQEQGSKIMNYKIEKALSSELPGCRRACRQTGQAGQDSNFVQFRGETWGTILKKPQCPVPHGIPISSVFLADGSDIVYAALSTEEKNSISHRGKAIHQLKFFLQQNFS